MEKGVARLALSREPMQQLRSDEGPGRHGDVLRSPCRPSWCYRCDHNRSRQFASISLAVLRAQLSDGIVAASAHSANAARTAGPYPASQTSGASSHRSIAASHAYRLPSGRWTHPHRSSMNPEVAHVAQTRRAPRVPHIRQRGADSIRRAVALAPAILPVATAVSASSCPVRFGMASTVPNAVRSHDVTASNPRSRSFVVGAN